MVLQQNPALEQSSLYTVGVYVSVFSHLYRKRCITSENQFDFLKDLVANVPDLPSNEEERDGEPKPKRYGIPGVCEVHVPHVETEDYHTTVA